MGQYSLFIKPVYLIINHIHHIQNFCTIGYIEEKNIKQWGMYKEASGENTFILYDYTFLYMIIF